MNSILYELKTQNINKITHLGMTAVTLIHVTHIQMEVKLQSTVKMCLTHSPFFKNQNSSLSYLFSTILIFYDNVTTDKQ